MYHMNGKAGGINDREGDGEKPREIIHKERGGGDDHEKLHQ